MNKYFENSLSVVFTAILLFLLFRKVNFSQMDFSKITLIIIIIPLIMFFLIKIINTYRYARIYNLKPNTKLFWLLCYSNLMLSIIPFRLGELSYIHGFKKYFNKRYTDSTEKLVMIRFADYVVVYILMLISSIYVSTQLRQGILQIISMFFIISLILFFGIIYFFSVKSFKMKNSKILKILSILKKGSTNMMRVSKKEIILLFLLTGVYWSVRLIMGVIILLMLGINISFFSIVFFSLVILLLGLLPIQTFMNFGIFEGGWAYFLVNSGFEYNLVITTILIYHFILIIVPTSYGIISYFVLKTMSLINKS